MPVIKVIGAPTCPLCDKRMQEVITKLGTFYVCTREFCMVSIHKDDPCCGKWMGKWPESAPKCPICKSPMRWFFRSDKFAKMQCRNKSHKLVQIMRGDARYMPKDGGI